MATMGTVQVRVENVEPLRKALDRAMYAYTDARVRMAVAEPEGAAFLEAANDRLECLQRVNDLLRQIPDNFVVPVQERPFHIDDLKDSQA